MDSLDSINELVNIIKKFPGLGVKSAYRIIFHLLKKSNEELFAIGKAFANLKRNLKFCSSCGNITEQDPCSICSNPNRDKTTLCVVEDFESLSAFEQARIYNGVYHVLNEKVDPLAGVDLSENCINFLLKHVKNLKPKEIIIATNPVTESSFTYYTLLDILKRANFRQKVSRLSQGLPVGGIIKFSDTATLHTSLESRCPVDLNSPS